MVLTPTLHCFAKLFPENEVLLETNNIITIYQTYLPNVSNKFSYALEKEMYSLIQVV